MIELLVVEDERLFRESLVHRLKKYPNINVVGVCENGIEALQLIETLQPNVVFTDIRMPGIDGLHLIEQLRKQNAEIIIVLLTAYTDFHLVKRALQLGVTDYLVKPLKNEELKQILLHVHKLLEQRKAERAVSDDHTEKNDIIATVKAWVNNHLRDATLESISEFACMNPSAFSRKFHSKTNMSFITYLTQQRIEKAEKLLLNPLYKISKIAEDIGYSDSHFSQVFKRHKGFTPQEFRELAFQIGKVDTTEKKPL